MKHVHGLALAAVLWASLNSAAAASAPWIEVQKLAAADAEVNDEFGRFVAVAGDVAMVGAHLDDHSGLVDAGSVYVFLRQADGSWRESQRLIADDAAAGDYFGVRLAFDGITLLVGAPGDDHSGLIGAGAAYVFENDGSSWRQIQKLAASDAAANDDFGGREGSIQGDILVVPARGDDHSGLTDAGSAYVFARDDSGWHEFQKLIPADPQHRGRFGQTTLISGPAIFVSATTKGIEYGSVYVFLLQGGGWVQTQKVVAFDGGRYDEFGTRLAMGGATFVAGAPEDNHSGYSNAGSAYLMEMVEGRLEHRQKITAADPLPQRFFGDTVTIEGDSLAVGAGSGGARPLVPGSVYLFGRQGSTWVEQQKLVPSDGGGGDLFGHPSVVLSQGTLFVSSPRHDHSGLENAGSVYLFAAGPNEPPVALCEDVVVPAGPECSAEASIDGGSYDPDGDEITLTQDPPGPYGLGVTPVSLMVSDGSLQDSCQATVTVRDEAAPFVSCNTPPSISAWEMPVSFTATATDNCGLRSVAVLSPSCHQGTSGLLSQDLCRFVTAGDTVTVESSGRSSQIRWLAEAVDQSGNRIERQCSVDVVSKPPPRPARR